VEPNIPLIYLGDFNIDFKKHERTETNDQRLNDTAAVIASVGVDDLDRHFHQQEGIENWTWSSYHEAKRV
jgi:hypothetical protein